MYATEQHKKITIKLYTKGGWLNKWCIRAGYFQWFGIYTTSSGKTFLRLNDKNHTSLVKDSRINYL